MLQLIAAMSVVLTITPQAALDSMVAGRPVLSAQSSAEMEFGKDFLMPESTDLFDEAILRQFHLMAFGMPLDGSFELEDALCSSWSDLSEETRNLWREFAGRTQLSVPSENPAAGTLTSILRYAAESGNSLPDVNTDNLTDLQRLYFVMASPPGAAAAFQNDPCPAVRNAVIQRNPNSAFSMLDDTSDEVRLNAAKAAGRTDVLLDMAAMEGPLGHMALAGAGQVPILEDSLYSSSDPAKRAAALMALLELGWRIPEERLDYLLTDPYQMVGAIAAEAAGRNFAMTPAKELPEDLPALNDVPESVLIETDTGSWTMILLKESAPVTCRSFWYLADRGFYNGIWFHRVIPGFVAQAGCPEGNGFGGPEYSIPAENNTVPFVRGTVGMADSGLGTGGSQFFIMLDSQRRLDCRYTAFGILESTEGIDNIGIGTRILEITAVNP